MGFVNTVINFWLPQQEELFLLIWITTGRTKKTFYHVKLRSSGLGQGSTLSMGHLNLPSCYIQNGLI
jgi:hypothetical protein